MILPGREDRFDVLVVGGGPAGASLALRLARAGRSVGLLEARVFPRSKPCGDAVSPGATPLLRELGVWPAIAPEMGGSMSLRGWRLYSPGGVRAEAPFSHTATGTPPEGLAIDRRDLDRALLDAAIAAGVTVLEGRRVHAALRDGDRLVGVRARCPDGRSERYRARFVAGADGLRSRVARLLGPVARGPRPRLALVGRYRGLSERAPWGELRLSREGVLGYAPTSPSGCNVTLVVPMAKASEITPDPRGFFDGRLRSYRAEHLIAGGRLARPLEVTGPFEHAPVRRTAPGVLLVGDASGYFDPFTGQGVFRALFAARLATTAIDRALERPEQEGPARRAYEAALDACFGPSVRLQRLIDTAVSHPRFMDPSVRLLGARRRLAERLVDAAGDRLPPSDVLRPLSWLAALADPRASEPSPWTEPRAHA